MPWAKTGTQPLSLYDKADERAKVVAQLQPNVIANVKSCREGWCRVIIGNDTSGFIKQERLWGVYPNETVE